MSDQERGVWVSRSPRAVFGGEVVAVLGDGQSSPMFGANLSESGMLLASPDPARPTPAVGDRLELIFGLPQLEAAVQVHARVVRRAEQPTELLVGVAFEHLAPGARRALRTYVFTGQARIIEYAPDEN